MYGRDYRGKTVRFEASGGLKNASLVMQDKETDSYWSIMEGVAVAGELEGQELTELPVGEKLQWRVWKQRHPDTLVLSVGGKEDGPNSYRNYFTEPEGFRGAKAKDTRLATKEPIYAFQRAGISYAVAQRAVENGAVFELADGSSVFLYRRKGASMFQSTDAYVSERGFEEIGGVWTEKQTGAQFDPKLGGFPGVEALAGFDTFWYNFSLNNPDTQLLAGP